MEYLPLIIILTPLLAIPLIFYSGERNRNLREFWSILASVIMFLLVLSLLPSVLQGKDYHFTLFQLLPGISFSFRVDALGFLFAVGASFLWILTTFYSIGYMRGHKELNQTRYFSFFAVALSTTMGVAFSANLFSMFLFYEALTLATYPLVGHGTDDEAKRGSRKYVIYLLGAAKLLLVAAIVITYNLAGTLEFHYGGIFPQSVITQKVLLSILYLMFIYGFAKCAIMPLHGWLPAAMVAPTPVSALLHAVAVVKTGVFTVLRVTLFIFGAQTLASLWGRDVAIFMAAFTITMASIIALTRDNLKARLAYSTISQLSYILLGAFMLTPSALIGSIFHITTHAFAKITLFFCAGSIIVCSHKTEVSQLSGLAKRMPITMTAFFIASLSMIGIPSSGGFISKWFLLNGTMQMHSTILLFVFLLSTVLNAGYFLPVAYKAFFEKENVDEHSHHYTKKIIENPFMAVPLAITAVISILLGWFPEIFLHLAKMVLAGF
ncbi:monovalent cation/H+ antiporter subunit D family protein [Thermodesulfobium sp.]